MQCYFQGVTSTEPRPESSSQQRWPAYGWDLPLVTAEFPQPPLLTLRRERTEDTSTGISNTGVQGHQSAVAQTKAAPCLCQPGLATKPERTGCPLGDSTSLHFSWFRNKSAGRTRFSRTEKSNLKQEQQNPLVKFIFFHRNIPHYCDFRGEKRWVAVQGKISEWRQTECSIIQTATGKRTWSYFKSQFEIKHIPKRYIFGGGNVTILASALYHSVLLWIACMCIFLKSEIIL